MPGRPLLFAFMALMLGSAAVENEALCDPPAAPAFVLNARDYGAKGEGRSDDAPALNRALAAAIKHGPGTTLLIPAGIYCLGQRTIALGPPPGRRGFHLGIEHADGLTVEGEPGTLLLSLDQTQTLFHVEESRHVTVRNLTIDAHPLQFTQGVITAADPVGHTLYLQVQKGYDDLDRADLAASPEVRICDNPFSDGWKEDQYFPHTIQRVRLGPGQWRVTLNPQYQYDAGLVGKKWMVWAKNIYRGWAVHVGHSDDILLEDLRIYEAGSGGFEFVYNGSVTARHCSIGPPPNSDRIFCGGGGAMSFFNRGTVTVEDCDFSHIDDDGFNLGTHFVRVVQKLDPQSCRTEAFPASFVVGDTLVLWDWRKKTERGEAKLVGAEKERDGHWRLHFDRPLDFGTVGEAPFKPSTNPGKNFLAAMNDGIDRLIDLESAGSCILRRNKISSMRARCFLVKTGHSLIEDNLFHDTHMPGVLAGPEFFWGEGPGLRGLIIRHNTFRNIDAPNISVATFDSPTGLGNRDVLIEDNTFEDYGRFPVIYMRKDPPGRAIQVRNTDGLTIRGNQIAPPTPVSPPMNPILIETCRNVQVSP